MSVYAGMTVLFEADIVDGALVNLKMVDTIQDPSKTLSAHLEQDAKGQMMLTTTNPFDRNLRIRMGMMPLSHDALVRTSSCPVIAGGSSFELWPYPIFQIFLGELRLMEPGDALECVE